MISLKNIKALSTLFIWYGFTIYLLISILTSNYRFVEQHQVNLLLLWISTISYFLGKIKGVLTTLLMLIIGIFANASFTISTFTLSIGFKISLTYSLLTCYFIIVNWNSLTDWIVEEFNSKASSDILDEE